MGEHTDVLKQGQLRSMLLDTVVLLFDERMCVMHAAWVIKRWQAGSISPPCPCGRSCWLGPCVQVTFWTGKESVLELTGDICHWTWEKRYAAC
jgi:hypothetical protein